MIFARRGRYAHFICIIRRLAAGVGDPRGPVQLATDASTSARVALVLLLRGATLKADTRQLRARGRAA
eukprot:9484227-Pyramimonas_sp.AAC.2